MINQRNIMSRPKIFIHKDFCLRCHRIFNSEGSHNRICSLCAKINNSIIYDNTLMFLASEVANELINNQRGKLIAA